MNDTDESSDRAEDIIIALQGLIELNANRYERLCSETVKAVEQIKDKGYFLPSALTSAYSCSFVENRDSLIHWSLYGASGAGVAIGFNQELPL